MPIVVCRLWTVSSHLHTKVLTHFQRGFLDVDAVDDNSDSFCQYDMEVLWSVLLIKPSFPGLVISFWVSLPYSTLLLKLSDYTAAQVSFLRKPDTDFQVGEQATYLLRRQATVWWSDEVSRVVIHELILQGLLNVASEAGFVFHPLYYLVIMLAACFFPKDLSVSPFIMNIAIYTATIYSTCLAFADLDSVTIGMALHC